MKPKKTQKKQSNKIQTRDVFQTPWYAVEPLLPYLSKLRESEPNLIIWESACGPMQNIVSFLKHYKYRVVATDLSLGFNYFNYTPDHYDIEVTNPPYSLKYDWLERSCELGKPFSLLLSCDSMFTQTGSGLVEKYDIEILAPKKRIDFITPLKGYIPGNSYFSTVWFTKGLNIGRRLTYRTIDNKGIVSKSDIKIVETTDTSTINQVSLF